jgi:hypothetical protein
MALEPSREIILENYHELVHLGVNPEVAARRAGTDFATIERWRNSDMQTESRRRRSTGQAVA